MLGKLVKQGAIYGVSTILGRLLSYLLTPYYTRLFVEEEYGIITDLYSIIPFALVLLTMGMESSYFRFSTRAKEEARAAGGSAEHIEREIQQKQRTLFATTWGATIALAALFTLAVVTLRAPINEVMGEAYVLQPMMVVVVAAIIFFDVIACVPFSRLREGGEARKYVAFKLLNIVMQVGLAVAFGVMGLFATPFGVGWALVANLIASVVTFVILVVTGLRVWPRISWPLLVVIFGYSIPLLLSGVASTATDFIDRQFIKYMTPEANKMAQLGIYGAVTKIAVVMTLFTQTYRLAAEPFFLAEFKERDFVESNAATMKYYVMATMAIFLFIALFKDLFAYIVSADFRQGIYILPVILASNLLMGIWLNLSFWYKREEKTKYAIAISMVGLVVTVVANLVLVPRHGYFGAAWARLICEGAMVGYSYYLCRRHYPIPYDLGRIVTYMALGGALYGVSVWYGGVVGAATWSNYAVSTALLASYCTFAVWREKIDVGRLLKSIIKRG
ncbi:MAG: oligosaccharide flippase family protein [Rikenellaceae bacterium]